VSLKDVLDAGINPALINVRAFGPARVWRIYPSAYGPDAYNGTPNGDARFSPLVRADGSVVPTLYAGTDLEVALMEVVLRELAIGCAGEQFMLPNRKKEWRRVTQLDLTVPLQLADLSNLTLRAWGLQRTDAIDCEASHYEQTRRLGLWIYENAPAAQGIIWTSRQLDRGQAMVFFGDRIDPAAIQVTNPDQALWSPAVQDALTSLAMQLHIDLDEEP
jgi:hypothetical protein